MTSPPIRGPRSGPATPSPAGSAATEDEGQRDLEATSASELSGKYPAGLHPSTELARHSHAARHAHRPSRSTSLDVRLTVAERAAVHDRAQSLGVKPSAWARAVMLDALDSRRNEVGRMHQAAQARPDPELARAVEQLRRIGVNLNQALRSHSAIDEELLVKVQASVDDVRASLGDRTRL